MFRVFISLMFLSILISNCNYSGAKYRGAVRDAEMTWRTEKRAPLIDSYSNSEFVSAAPITIMPSAVRSGNRIFLRLSYTVFGTCRSKNYPITQILSVVGQGVNTELLRRKVEKPPGTHISYLRITLPKDGDPGQYVIISRFVAGQREASAKGSFKVLETHSRQH